MGHVSRERLLTLVESSGPVDDPHVLACDRCRNDVAALQSLVREMRDVDVPEPSPLFWDHLSGRIRHAVHQEAERGPVSGGWQRWALWASPLSAAVVLALVAVLPARQAPEVALRATPPTENEVADLVRDVDPGWQFVVEAVGESAAASVALVAAVPGATDDLVNSLDNEERASLAALLQAELGEP